jgi:hypothetical protein
MMEAVMRNPWKITTLILALLLAVQLVPRAIAQTSQQPRLKAALTATQSAIRQLDKAAGNKAGHRVKAIKLLHDAEREIRLAIDVGE